MGKSSGTTKTTSTSNPSSFQQPYIDTLLAESKRLYDSAGPSFFPGNTVAGFSPTEQTAQDLLKSKAYEQSVFNDVAVRPATAVGLNSYDVANNPVVQNMASAATRPIIQQLREQVLPDIRSGAILSGTQGGSRQGIAEAQGMERAARAAMDSTSQIYGNAYGQGLNLLSSTLGQIPALSASTFQPGQILSTIGGQERDLNQARINEELARWTYNQQLPYTKLAEYGNAISRPFGGQSTSEVAATGDNTGQTIGGILSGLGSVLSLINLFKGIMP